MKTKTPPGFIKRISATNTDHPTNQPEWQGKPAKLPDNRFQGHSTANQAEFPDVHASSAGEARFIRQMESRRILADLIPPPAHGDHGVYVLFAVSGEPVYVGCTRDIWNRLRYQAREKAGSWSRWSFVHSGDAVSARRMEATLIDVVRPSLNRRREFPDGHGESTGVSTGRSSADSPHADASGQATKHHTTQEQT